MNTPIKRFYGGNFDLAIKGINFVKNFRVTSNNSLVIYYYNIPLSFKERFLNIKPEISWFRDENKKFVGFDKNEEIKRIRYKLVEHLNMREIK